MEGKNLRGNAHRDAVVNEMRKNNLRKTIKEFFGLNHKSSAIEPYFVYFSTFLARHGLVGMENAQCLLNIYVDNIRQMNELLNGESGF